MTTHSHNLTAFALAAGHGRTPEPLDILGEEVLIKLTDADTNGATAIFHLTVPPMSGPPLHRHSRDEWFYVLAGEITAEIDGRRTVFVPGDCAFAPRCTAHTYQSFGDAVAQMLLMVTPGDFNRFFEKLSFLNPRAASSGSCSNRKADERLRDRVPRATAVVSGKLT
jgi:mannose-6-phosphate isomerase-like protein (cupin superfamily)